MKDMILSPEEQTLFFKPNHYARGHEAEEYVAVERWRTVDVEAMLQEQVDKCLKVLAETPDGEMALTEAEINLKWNIVVGYPCQQKTITEPELRGLLIRQGAKVSAIYAARQQKWETELNLLRTDYADRLAQAVSRAREDGRNGALKIYSAAIANADAREQEIKEFQRQAVKEATEAERTRLWGELEE